MYPQKMIDIVSKVLPSAPLIKVYTHYCILNRKAMKLLGITENAPYVRVTRIAEEHRKDRLYIGHTAEVTQFEVVLYDDHLSGRINSTHLAREISECLQGIGVYKICPDYFQLDIEGDKYYEIFFKNYKK